jgi:AraC-like DNA-binding protein
MFSEIRALVDVAAKLDEPVDYLKGAIGNNRPICSNLLVFLRQSRKSLQQRSLSNRLHPRHVLMICLETEGLVSVDGSTFRLSPGEAFLVFPYQYHHYLDTASPQLRWLFLTFELQSGFDSLGLLRDRIMLLERPDFVTLHDLVNRYPQQNQMDPVGILPLIDKFLWDLINRQEGRVSRRRRPISREAVWLERVEKLLLQSVEENWTLAEVARRVGISERQMRNRFEATTGVGLREYRANYQLHQAINLLRNTNLNLGQIASRCGFQSQSVFNRFIQREVNLSPKAFRTKLASR